jgi:C-terminal processing protease CtpA/Prc
VLERNHRTMNPIADSGAVTRGRAALLATVLLALAAATPAWAQRDSVRPVGESRFENEIESLAQQLVQKRVSLENLTRALQGLRMTLRSGDFPDSLRRRFEMSIRQMQARLASTESERSRLQKKLGDLCSADLRPDGWMGMAFTGESRVWKDGNGPVVFRYLDYPSVESVESRSPAEKAGLQGGDLILSFGGQDIRERDLVFSELLKPGRKLMVKIRRGVEIKTLTLNVERRPDDFETPCPWLDESIASAFAPVRMQYSFTTEDFERRAPTPEPPLIVRARPPAAAAPLVAVTPPVPPVPPTPSPFEGFQGSMAFGIAGAQVTALNADLADAFGAESGILVLSTTPRTPAEESGLKGGDIILSAGGRRLNSPMGFIRAIEQLGGGREIKLVIWRKKKQQTLVLRW